MENPDGDKVQVPGILFGTDGCSARLGGGYWKKPSVLDEAKGYSLFRLVAEMSLHASYLWAVGGYKFVIGHGLQG
jgi:hypothetical protein